MARRSAIQLSLAFYRQHPGLTPLSLVLLITGLSGILETLPFLLALPLIRSIYLDLDHVAMGGLSLPLWAYTFSLIVLLLLRFYIGALAQQLSDKNRIEIQTRFKARGGSQEREERRQAMGRSIQSLSFLLNGFSQLVPGLLFTLAGAALNPAYGGVTLAIILIWMLPLRWLKKGQDISHHEASDLTQNLSESPTEIELASWKKSKIRASWYDSVNKNAREFVVISTLVIGLTIAHKMNIISGPNALFIVVVFLRGLQQLFTAYIMAQQVIASRRFLEETTQN